MVFKEERAKHKMYYLISEFLKQQVNMLMKAADDLNTMILEELNEYSIKMINYIFKEEPVIRKRFVKAEGRVYYGFYIDETLIFEYGLEGIEDESEI